ncbi:MAG: DUF4071 domain-containing protein, partial [Acidobacteriota bacterium]
MGKEDTGAKRPKDDQVLAELLAKRLYREFQENQEHSGETRPFEEIGPDERTQYVSQAQQLLEHLLTLDCRSLRTIAGDTQVPAPGEDSIQIQARIDDRQCGMSELLSVWQTRNSEVWASAPHLHHRLARRFIKLGEPLVAYDVVTEGLKEQPDDPQLRQLLALALARSGVQERAETVLLELIEDGYQDEETLGTLARIHKDLWQLTSDPAEKRRQLERAFETYEEAYRLTGGYWTGINAATMAAILGRNKEAGVLAREALHLCQKDLDSLGPTDDRYWALATLGEACLILRDMSGAEEWYREAAEAGKGRIGDLSSTLRNARLLFRHLKIDGSRIEACFKLPRVVVFTGHMVDRPNRPIPRFPPALVPHVRAEIRRRLEKLDAQTGYASAACGGDILFHEAMLDRGGEAHVVLPFESEEFIRESVDLLPDGDWVQRYYKIRARESSLVVASTGKFGGVGIAYEYANFLLKGLASIRA